MNRSEDVSWADIGGLEVVKQGVEIGRFRKFTLAIVISFSLLGNIGKIEKLIKGSCD